MAGGAQLPSAVGLAFRYTVPVYGSNAPVAMTALIVYWPGAILVGRVMISGSATEVFSAMTLACTQFPPVEPADDDHLIGELRMPGEVADRPHLYRGNAERRAQNVR